MAVVGASAAGYTRAWRLVRVSGSPAPLFAFPPALPERAQTLSLAPDLSHHSPEQIFAVVVARSWYLEQKGFWSCACWDVDYAWNSLDACMSVCNRILLWFSRRELGVCMLRVMFQVYFPALWLREQLVQAVFFFLPLVRATIQPRWPSSPLHSVPFLLSPDTFSLRPRIRL